MNQAKFTLFWLVFVQSSRDTVHLWFLLTVPVTKVQPNLFEQWTPMLSIGFIILESSLFEVSYYRSYWYPKKFVWTFFKGTVCCYCTLLQNGWDTKVRNCPLSFDQKFPKWWLFKSPFVGVWLGKVSTCSCKLVARILTLVFLR